jgi:hypothetical protein
MPSLHIEHPISDLDTWLGAFNAFAEARANAGVRSARVRHPAGDPSHIVVDLDFDTVEAAEGFHTFLRTNVWSSPEASPALAGTPEAAVLEDVALS